MRGARIDRTRGWRQGQEETRQEVAVTRLEKMAREPRNEVYVVRDLSWELARFLDAEIFSAIPSATPTSVNGNGEKKATVKR